MRIVVETERESWRIKNDVLFAIVIRAKVDGQEEVGLSQALSNEECRSNFDVLWDFLGKKMKKAIIDQAKKEEIP